MDKRGIEANLLMVIILVIVAIIIITAVVLGVLKNVFR